jgi:hypothetical protein
MGLDIPQTQALLATTASACDLPTQGSNNPTFKTGGTAHSNVDELIDLTNLLYQQEEGTEEVQDKVAELATCLKNSLPSSPSQAQAESVPSPSSAMQLPSINSLSTEIPALQNQLLPPITNNAVKKQYPFYPSPAQLAPQPTQPSLILPSLPHSNPTQQRRPARAEPVSPYSSPCSSPPPSPKRCKKNYTKEFNVRFHNLLSKNEHASNEWHIYSQRHKGKCTIKRAPCIKVSRGFCASYGQEFTDLAKEEKYGALGTRTECACRHKPAPLCSTGPARKQRQPARSIPYPEPVQNQSPGTPQDLELPSTPGDSSSSLTKQAWMNFLLQSAPILHEGFNKFMGGMRCSACAASRAFASEDVVAFLTKEPIPCTHCTGHMQLRQ